MIWASYPTLHAAEYIFPGEQLAGEGFYWGGWGGQGIGACSLHPTGGGRQKWEEKYQKW